MKKLPLIFLFYSCLLYAQEMKTVMSNKDSVLYYLSISKTKNKYQNLQKAFNLSYSIDNDSLRKESIIQFGLQAYFKNDTLGIHEATNNLKLLFDKTKDSTLLAKFYHYKALFFRRTFQKDSSFYYYHRSKNISILLKDSVQVGRRLLSMGYMQNDEADYVGAQNTLTEALRYLEPSKKSSFIGDSYCAIGNALIKIGDFEESRKYYLKTRDVFDTIKDIQTKNRWELIVLNNLGNTFLLESNPRTAIEYFEQGLSLVDSIQFKHPLQYRLLLGNLADCQYLLGEKDKAFRNFDELFRIRSNNNDDFGLARSHNGYAHHYQLEGNNKLALFHAKKAYEISTRIKDNSVRLSALSKLVGLTTGRISNEYFKNYLELDDSLKTKERFFKNQYARIRFETEKKDKENTVLKLENAQQDLQIASERQKKQLGWLVSIVAILALGLSINFFRTRRKKLLYQAQLQKAVAREEERQQIAKSLHDEVAGDLRILHQKLSKTDFGDEAQNLEKIKNNVRNLSHQLSSVSFDEVSFKDQIINLISDHFSTDFKIRPSGIDTVDWKSVNEAIKRTLYLSIRESLQNTIKYAQATQFLIEFSSDKKEIVLHLKDNGKGFNPNKGKKGIGLKNLKERVEEIQGSFHVESSKEGTITTLKIPLNGK